MITICGELDELVESLLVINTKSPYLDNLITICGEMDELVVRILVMKTLIYKIVYQIDPS